MRAPRRATGLTRVAARPFLRPDETLTALTTEAAGLFRALGFRTTSHTNGKRLTPQEWETLREQWRAIQVIAGHAVRSCDRALFDGTYTLPVTKQGLRDLAEELEMTVAPFEGYTALKERVIEELRMRAEVGR